MTYLFPASSEPRVGLPDHARATSTEISQISVTGEIIFSQTAAVKMTVKTRTGIVQALTAH
jgi:hypothetical protein